MKRLSNDNIRKAVRKHYSRVALSGNSGCGYSTSTCCNGHGSDAKNISIGLGYSKEDVNDVPYGANMGLGCRNPKVIASIKPGETVLDLGSGGGFDCFLAAKEVGESGRVIGVDMTPEMISKARKNAEITGYRNVEFRLGEIENLPVPDSFVDVIISNCVINLSPSKSMVFKEAFRVLKPGGRIVISDVVSIAALPDKMKYDMDIYTGCMSGASSITNIHDMLEEAGFNEIKIKPEVGSKDFIKHWVPDSRIEDYVVSAIIEAIKPKI